MTRASHLQEPEEGVMIHYSLQVHPAGHRSCKQWGGGVMEGPAELASPSAQREPKGEHVWTGEGTHLPALSRGRRVGHHHAVPVTRRGRGILRRQERFK